MKNFAVAFTSCVLALAISVGGMWLGFAGFLSEDHVSPNSHFPVDFLENFGVLNNLAFVVYYAFVCVIFPLALGVFLISFFTDYNFISLNVMAITISAMILVFTVGVFQIHENYVQEKIPSITHQWASERYGIDLEDTNFSLGADSTNDKDGKKYYVELTNDGYILVDKNKEEISVRL